MTIIGAHVLAPDLAVCWADSELYDHAGNGIGMVSKLVVNPAGFAFTMTGWDAVATKAAACVTRATSMRSALQALPLILRRSSEQAATNASNPGAYGGQWAALIGWDPEGPAMHAYRFTASECFVPMLDYQQSVPLPRISLAPDGPSQVRMIAEQQLELMRDGGKAVLGGPLHVAVIRPSGISCSRICDLATPVMLQEKEAA